MTFTLPAFLFHSIHSVTDKGSRSLQPRPLVSCGVHYCRDAAVVAVAFGEHPFTVGMRRQRYTARSAATLALPLRTGLCRA